MTRRFDALSFALALLASLGLIACGEEEQVTQQRGLGANVERIQPGKPGAKPKPGTRRTNPSAKPGDPQPAEAEPEFERPKRADLTRDDFSGRARDPFHNYLAADALDAPAPVEIVRKEREVKLAEYTFDELRLIAIVNAGRSVAPRALFLASDNKSKTVKQGEYFSSAEVLLASVNRDYIEIEVVDPELTPGWNLERGERKVIYLKEGK